MAQRPSSWLTRKLTLQKPGRSSARATTMVWKPSMTWSRGPAGPAGEDDAGGRGRRGLADSVQHLDGPLDDLGLALDAVDGADRCLADAADGLGAAVHGLDVLPGALVM